MKTAARRAPSSHCSLLVALPSAASADERILRYLSDVQIQRDSSLEVTETIDVRAEHDRINHGISPRLPDAIPRAPRRPGSVVGFTFEGATLDGLPVPASAADRSRTASA